ncbi:primary-amine oxidase [Capronia epimyces CBS 606.96]|uniref:Amine oxidase n=1 Tax=Capronia epimyces CBS 606.96 TaxID=1182542 RepID=W9XU91_9EURO|nr:primary-amine oxidase [Capronia epimyces CBS 606.96]EXJ80880.1 primary-amine oxidase [Capronia epimyces CBS 606.96]
MAPTTHPLDPITPAEIRQAVQILRDRYPNDQIRFKLVDIFECPKAEVVPYLEKQRLGQTLPAPPARRARIYFHLARNPHLLNKARVNVTAGLVEAVESLPDVQGPVDFDEWLAVQNACNAHPRVLEEVERLKLPPGAKVVNDPWAYGTDDAKERRRLFQCWMYIVLNGDPEANHYSLPAPFSPVFDAVTNELQWIDYLPMGADDERESTRPWEPVPAVEYSTNLLDVNTMRKDLKPLQVVQPQGPSFQVEGRNVSWQKWKFNVGWTMREGPVLQNVTYDGRSTFYRLSLSEMTVPYGDPRSPYHRKQAFDLGDSGLGMMSNSLKLGCDCLGLIKYFDGYRVTSTGSVVTMPNVVCMHEVDAGVGWKHTNFRSGTTSVVRNRQLVIQCTATVANYEYIFAFILDQAANIHFELRATGIVSTMPIKQGVQVPWGTIVAPGVLAGNHQHLFSIRIDPAIDGHNNTVVCQDVVPAEETDPDPYGCAFKARETEITQAGGYTLDVDKSRLYKIENTSSINPISGKPVAYKLHAIPSQMMIMKPWTFNWKRGQFASKPIWVTKYQDDELWAAGEFTNQSREDTGLAVWAKRPDNVQDTDVVLWHSFGLTHLPRPEDFPVMPQEMMTVTLKPSNFFALNPSNDVPRSNQAVNQSTLVEGTSNKGEGTTCAAHSKL